MKKPVVYILLFVLSEVAISQTHQIQIGTDIPIQYMSGYKFSSSKGLGFSTHAGFLTKPYSDIILNIIEAAGVNEALVEISRNAFKSGLIVELSGDYNWGKNYVGLKFQWINLLAGNTPLDIIETIYNIKLSDYWPAQIKNPFPGGSGFYGDEVTAIALNSSLYQIGFFYGRRFILTDNFEIHTEAGITKNITSVNNFSSKTPYPQSLYNLMADDLHQAYSKYVYIPYLGIHFVYTL